MSEEAAEKVHPIDIVKTAHLVTTGDKVSSATDAELWMAVLITELWARYEEASIGGFYRKVRDS